MLKPACAALVPPDELLEEELLDEEPLEEELLDCGGQVWLPGVPVPQGFTYVPQAQSAQVMPAAVSANRNFMGNLLVRPAI